MLNCHHLLILFRLLASSCSLKEAKAAGVEVVSCAAVVAVITTVLQSLVLAQLTGSVVLVGVMRGDGLVVTLGVMGELTVSRLMSNWLVGHGLLEVNW
jgi:hypothetical protein